MDNQNLSLFETSGYSMWPFLKQGARLVIKKAAGKDLKIGDMVLYKKAGQTICHRLVKKAENKEGVIFYIRGDNSTSKPEIVLENMLVGKVVGIIKNNKTINLDSKTCRITNFFIAITGPALNKILRSLKSFKQCAKYPWSDTGRSDTR
jgi:signal peptidase I